MTKYEQNFENSKDARRLQISKENYRNYVIDKLLYMLMLMNKFTTGFSGEKSAQDTGSFENGNSVEKKKGVHDFMCTTSLMCKKQYINITEELNSKQRNQNSDIYFTENIPKTSKNASHVLECECF